MANVRDMGASASSDENPWLISVDDHVTGPPELWTSRLPAKFRQRGPQVRRDRLRLGADAREGRNCIWGQ